MTWELTFSMSFGDNIQIMALALPRILSKRAHPSNGMQSPSNILAGSLTEKLHPLVLNYQILRGLWVRLFERNNYDTLSQVEYFGLLRTETSNLESKMNSLS
jgi:hypothetical protein